MADEVRIDTVNFEEVKQALMEAPLLAFRFARQELARGGTRFRKRFIRERMSGRPGIQWDEARVKIGGNVAAVTTGKDLTDLRLTVRISRLLRVHEEGATITPQRGEWLYLSRKTGTKGAAVVFARARSVMIPARLGFVRFWDQEVPTLLDKVHAALGRAVAVAFEQRLKAAGALTRRLAA